ncbi:MAG: AAA family ATPase [Plectolyngbya sp. WJT66-NPBG17]|jgi:hypothetical protein|nr:AAA family ATPase [Plectolyngbya sp. WJT66-NPBG17]
MKIRIKELELVCKRARIPVPFETFTYFYGPMGAGKTSIARLIDYCFGGELELSTALQNEFVSAVLHLTINEVSLTIERSRESDNVRAQWTIQDETFEVVIPARTASGIIIPNTEVEVLSDLIFYVAGHKPPRVRKSKTRNDSELTRLSIRNLLWYCYVDQDNIDSSFFNLDKDANSYKRNSSRDALRFIVGFHQELVSELETELQELREKRLQVQGAAKSLQEALTTAEVASEEDIVRRINSLETECRSVKKELQTFREQARESITSHGVDVLRNNARVLSYEIDSIEQAIPDIEKTIDNDSRHVHELRMLGLKFQRVTSARAVLSGVEFEACPRCAQSLPERESHCCLVCGQDDTNSESQHVSTEVIRHDTDNRISELQYAISRHTIQLQNMRFRLSELVREKQQIDNELNQEMEQYDSAYLSSALVLERKKAGIEQHVTDLRRLVALPRKVDQLYRESSELEVKESELRRRLNEARKQAESNRENLGRLESLFLDCLIRARIPGIGTKDTVEISSPAFLPEVKDPRSGDLAVTSFANLSSGGKKTLFKACFALAIHRLAVEIGARLPTFLIIDSPMKNISERENRKQFEGFHELVYDLASSELEETQFILIDKEFCPPSPNLDIELCVRHMTPDEDQNPPLISYYRGL